MANLRTKTWWRLLVTGLLIGLLAGPTHILATKVSDLTALTVDDIADPSDVYVLVTDAQSTAASRKVPLDQLGLATHLRLLTATSHGLAAGDVGKPLYGNDVFDDTSNTQYPTWVLAGIVDANTLLVAGDGAQVTIDVAKLQNGASYDVNTLGYAVYWDYSASTYYAAKPDDSESFADPVLLVTSVGVSTFDAIVVAKGGLQATSDRIIRATGLVAIDQANFNAAETALEALGGGRICIEGKITLDTDVNFTQPISLYGIPGTSPEIELTNDTSINWQSAYSPFSGSSTTIPATAAKQSFVKVPTGTLAAGDWIVAASDDTLEGVTHSSIAPSGIIPPAASTGASVTADASTNFLTYNSHGLVDNTAVIFTAVTSMPGGLSEGQTYWVVNKTTNTFQVAATRAGSAIDLTSAESGRLTVKSIYANCPAEMHQVKEIRGNDGTYDYAMIDDVIIDALTVNPRIYELTPMEGYSVENLKFSWTGDSTPSDASLNIRKSANVRVSNCHWENGGPNEVIVGYSANVTLENLTFGSKRAYNTSNGYGVVVGVVNNLILCDSVFYGCRHAFTTTSGGASNGARYGTPRNVVVSNCIAHQTGSTTSSLIAFDTHAEGWGVVFDSCKAVVPYDPRNPTVASPTENTNYGFQSRSRHTTFRNCIVEGTPETYGISVLSDDCRIEYCSIQGGWRGVHCREDTTGVTSGCNRMTVKHTSFDDLTGAGIAAPNGSTHHISYCEFDDVGATTYSGISKACIHLGEGSGHRIHSNSMPQQDNTYSIGGTGWVSLEIAGNVMTGYTGVSGVTDSGLDSTNADAVGMQVLCDAYNFTD